MHGEPLMATLLTPRGSSSAPVKPAKPRLAPVQPERETEPLFHVVLHDDDDHTYRYVVEMIVKIFGYDPAKAFDMACEVDENGVVILATLDEELARWRVRQIHDYGADPYSKNSKGSMKATLEPAE